MGHLQMYTNENDIHCTSCLDYIELSRPSYLKTKCYRTFAVYECVLKEALFDIEQPFRSRICKKRQITYSPIENIINEKKTLIRLLCTKLSNNREMRIHKSGCNLSLPSSSNAYLLEATENEQLIGIQCLADLCSANLLSSVCICDKITLTPYHFKASHVCIRPNVLYSFNTDSTETAVILNTQFGDCIFPIDSQFLLSDLKNISTLIKYHRNTIDFMVIDPPWDNRSVKRKSTYKWLSDSELIVLPISSLASSSCIVACWCTNSSRHQNFLKNSLFPAWGVRFSATFYWVKITKHGDPCVPLESTDKKPYEPLFVGLTGDLPYEFPDNYIFCSIPSRIHSLKPNVKCIFDKWLPPNPRCMELFARCLYSGFISWGNEVFKYQSVDMFDFNRTN